MEGEKLTKKQAELEALLFIHGEPISVLKLGKILDAEPKEVEELLESYKKVLEDEGRGLRLLTDSERVQLVTKPEFSKILEKFVTDELSEDLTLASIETLSITAYLGPIPRSRLEYIRGVNSTFTLRNLLLRGLVERFPDPKRPNTYLYRPSFGLLRHLGLSEAKDLPEYEKFNALVKRFEMGEESEAPPVAAEAASPGTD